MSPDWHWIVCMFRGPDPQPCDHKPCRNRQNSESSSDYSWSTMYQQLFCCLNFALMNGPTSGFQLWIMNSFLLCHFASHIKVEANGKLHCWSRMNLLYDVRRKHILFTHAWWIRCKKYQQRRSGHIKKKEYGKDDTEIVCFDDVITCSLTTKRRQQRTQGKERKWRHKMDNCGFVETKKGQKSLLFNCTVHSIMWTIRNSKALGKEKTAPLSRLFNSFSFEDLDEMVFAIFFPTLHEMSYEVSDSF